MKLYRKCPEPFVPIQLQFNPSIVQSIKDHVYETIIINSNRQMLLLLCPDSMFNPPAH